MYQDIVVLAVLAEKPAHGYEIKRRLAETFGGWAELNNNTLYPALRRFSESGAVTKVEEPQAGRPTRHTYTLTKPGHRLLRDLLVDFGADLAVRKEEFLTRVALFALLQPAERHMVLEARARALQELVTHLESLHEEVAMGRITTYDTTEDRAKARPWARMVLEHRLSEVRHEQAWVRVLGEDAPARSRS
ncbi:MAG: PadR family transcriptional regulator [Micromonosporaceae bacterium]